MPPIPIAGQPTKSYSIYYASQDEERVTTIVIGAFSAYYAKDAIQWFVTLLPSKRMPQHISIELPK